MPELNGDVLPGIQHKYRETALFSLRLDKLVIVIAVFVLDGHNL